MGRWQSRKDRDAELGFSRVTRGCWSEAVRTSAIHGSCSSRTAWGAFATRIHSWQLCAVRGVYCCQKGWLLPDCQMCLALWLLSISLDQVFRQNRTLVCVDNAYKSRLASGKSGKGDPLLQIINRNSLSLPLSNTVNTATCRLSPLVQTLFLLVLSFCRDVEIDVGLANASNL